MWDFWEFIAKHAEREWAVIQGAPGASLLLFVLAFALAYLAIHWRYSGLIDALNGQREPQREQVADYRGRLGLAPPNKTSYSKLTNQELKKVVGEFVGRLEVAASRLDKSALRPLPEQDDELQRAIKAAKTIEDRERLQKEFIDREVFVAGVERTMRTELYHREIRPKVLVLRDELIRRLPTKPPEPGSVYDRLVGPTPVHDIATDLQRLASLLPEPERDSRQ